MKATKIQLVELTVNGKNLFRKWLLLLGQRLQIEVDVRLERVKKGNPGNWRALGDGVYELKFYSGLRIYYGWNRRDIIVLILGGTKSRQTVDIDKAKKLWELFPKKISVIN